MGKKMTGFTSSTMKKRLLDAGVFFKNYDLSKTYQENRAAGNLICATQGGGSFVAAPSVRQVTVDGMASHTVGMEENDEWTAELSLKMLEADAELAAMALGAATVESVPAEGSPVGYLRVKPRDTFAEDDYLENVVWVGRWVGDDKPVIIVLYNALSLGGLSWTMEDKKEVITECKLTAHYGVPDDAGNVSVPFDIFFPEVASK